MVFRLAKPKFPQDSAIYVIEDEKSDACYKAVTHSALKDIFASHDQSMIEQLIKNDMNEAVTLAVPTTPGDYLSAEEVVDELSVMICQNASVFSDLAIREAGEYIEENFCFDNEFPIVYLIKIFEETKTFKL